MKKLSLNLDQLEVESFETELHVTDERGTVRGAMSYGTEVAECRTRDLNVQTCAGCGDTENTCDPWNGWCNMSQGGPMHTACDFSCEFACP